MNVSFIFLNFAPKMPYDTANFNVYFPYFRNIGPIQFSGTCYAKSVALSKYNVLHFY